MSQIILKENIRKLGRVGQIVDVAPGYAFNFLIPQSKAVPATKANIALLEQEREQIIKEDAIHRENALKISQTLPSSIFLARDINENGVLYGHISAKDILEQFPQIKDKHSIHFKKHINSYGVYEIQAELHHDIIVKIQLSISDTIDNAKKQLEQSLQSKKAKKLQEVQESSGQENQKNEENTVQNS